MNKALTLVICVLIGIVLFMLISYANIKAELTAKEYELASLTLTLENQNAQIKALEIDLQIYQEAKPKIQEKIITKYVALSPSDSSCEARLHHIQDLVNAWYGISKQVSLEGVR
ncbi:hypothetical protein [uncultured Helicobacter sp.]|uniref:hypothetical protein n=1 Tax=uncultured Helicobacter sp. TaxID=175537 RepID=UPI00374F6D69